MSDFHFIAVLTYGTEKQHGLSSFKIGRGAGTDVLLALFGSRAKETTPPQASYRYIHVEVKGMATHHNYLVMRVTPDEKAHVEALCRKVGSYTWVYLWEHESRRWLEFPCAPQAYYIDPSSYGGSCPKFPPTHARFITPSKLTDDEGVAETAGSVTLTQSGDWWWIAGDTYPHREVLRAAGAKWSNKRREWYYKGEHLPHTIRALAAVEPSAPELSPAPIPHSIAPPVTAVTPTVEQTDESEADSLDTAQDLPEALMRSVRTDDVTAALVAHIHDNERNKPILVDFIGSRNAVKQLLSKPFNPAYLGARAEGSAFTLTDGSRYTGFRLPDTAYKTMNTALGGRVVEGRIVTLDATVSAPRESCYVLVMNRIELPTDEGVEEAWLHYVRFRQTPNRPEFSRYAPPIWASDLYNVYQALRTRIGRPLHERWMPWLFAQVADKPRSSETLSLREVTLCKYIAGYVDPKARGVVEGGAYRLTCRDMVDLWAEIIVCNPHRADGITFSQQQ